MIWLRRLGWIALAAATLVASLAIYLFQLPEPDHAIVLSRATYVAPNGQAQPIALPHSAARRPPGQTADGRYLTGFELIALPAEPLFLLIPAVNRQISLTFNGQPLFDNSAQTFWSGALIRRSVLVHLPQGLFKTGHNELAVELEESNIEIPSYLSKLYVGSEAALLPTFKLRDFLEQRLKTMALAAQVLLGIGILLAYFYRPTDPLFSWLAAVVAASTVLFIGYSFDFTPAFDNAQPYLVALSSAPGFLFIGFALALIGIVPPKALRTVTFLVPGLSILSFLSGLVRSRIVVFWINIPIFLATMIVATAVVAWGAFRRESTDARIMLAPFFLLTWFLIRDIAVATGYLEGSLLLAPYVRPLFLATIMAVLMRRLALSLGHLDRANENLNRRLAEQEAELASLHRAERIEAARLVREQERQRLTHDLHDGISGHLVSIIAMTERSGGDAKPIEQAARRALDDLRLVIYSLDLGDRELPLALANFRERLIPQLQRLGVDLDWSIAGLPEVSGVTPGNALSILRILQEAITNALKHGPARRIVIRGTASGDGRVAITVENDGCSAPAAGTGFGLDNMRRRARQLNGSVAFERLDHGARLTLTVPTSLPDFEEADAR